MKNLSGLLIISILLGCSANHEQDSDSHSDSTLADTTSFVDADSTLVAEPDEISAALAKLIVEHKEKSGNYFELRLSASGHEYQTEEIWSFDSLLNLAHCYQNGQSDGNQGLSHHFFQQDKLYAVQDKIEYDGGEDLSLFHKELGGIAFSKTKSRADSTLKSLEKKFLYDAEKDLKKEFRLIVKLLKDHHSKITASDPATLRVESVIREGGTQAKEITNISIDRPLLDKLLK